MMGKFQGIEMEIIKGGRDRLERDLACELFKPADNQERVAELMRQLEQRGKLHKVQQGDRP